MAGAQTTPSTDAIRLSPDDNVATLLRSVEAGEVLTVRSGGDRLSVRAGGPIPLCHKICLVALEGGEAVVKYGQRIGSATARIAEGEHVHVHNMRSDRARADGDTSG